MNLIIQEIEEDRQREKEDLEEKEKKWMEKLISALRRQETEMAAERKLNDIWQKLKFLQFNVDLI